MLLFLSPQTYSGSSLRTDLSSDQIVFAPPDSLLSSRSTKFLTVKPSASDALFPVPSASVSEFSLLIGYKISSGVILSPVNIAAIASLLSIRFLVNTQATLGSCSMNYLFMTGSDQGEWLPSALTYDGSKLRLYRFYEVS